MPADKTPFRVGDRVRLLDEFRTDSEYEWSPRLLREEGWYIVDIVYPDYQLSLEEIRTLGQYQVVADNRDRTRVWVHHIEQQPADDPNVHREHRNEYPPVLTEPPYPETFTVTQNPWIQTVRVPSFTFDDPETNPFEEEEEF